MRHTLVYMAVLAAGLAASCGASAKTVVTGGGCDLGGLTTYDVRISHVDDKMVVGMTLLLDSVEVKSRQAVLITPYIISETDSVELPSVGIYGRRRYYYDQRYNDGQTLGGEEGTVIPAREMPSTYAYEATIAYEDWMENCALRLMRQDYGCRDDIEGEESCTLATVEAYVPRFIYVRPHGEGVKTRTLSGSAMVCFPVSRTEIQPDYRDNRSELGKIEGTIASVKGDADMSITAISLKGYASPEGSYANNERLAKARTEALRDYVIRLSGVPSSVITAGSEAENWEGLREYVEASCLENRNEILRLIDSPEEPDRKERLIRERYPADYATLLKDCYPALRRTDYKVDYVVRSFTDPEEIRHLVITAPQKLSLEEFYLAAEGLEPGSEEFNQVFDVAVRMYPDDETANLNAANAAMERGDMDAARAYLDRAGSSREAVYARGVYEALNGNEAKADELFRQSRLLEEKDAKK